MAKQTLENERLRLTIREKELSAEFEKLREKRESRIEKAGDGMSINITSQGGDAKASGESSRAKGGDSQIYSPINTGDQGASEIFNQILKMAEAKNDDLAASTIRRLSDEVGKNEKDESRIRALWFSTTSLLPDAAKMAESVAKIVKVGLS